MSQEGNPSPVERMKKESDGLRGTIAEALKNEITGAIGEEDQNMIKFLEPVNLCKLLPGTPFASEKRLGRGVIYLLKKT